MAILHSIGEQTFMVVGDWATSRRWSQSSAKEKIREAIASQGWGELEVNPANKNQRILSPAQVAYLDRVYGYKKAKPKATAEIDMDAADLASFQEPAHETYTTSESTALAIFQGNLIEEEVNIGELLTADNSDLLAGFNSQMQEFEEDCDADMAIVMQQIEASNDLRKAATAMRLKAVAKKAQQEAVQMYKIGKATRDKTLHQLEMMEAGMIPLPASGQKEASQEPASKKPLQEEQTDQSPEWL